MVGTRGKLLRGEHRYRLGRNGKVEHLEKSEGYGLILKNFQLIRGGCKKAITTQGTKEQGNWRKDRCWRPVVVRRTREPFPKKNMTEPGCGGENKKKKSKSTNLQKNAQESRQQEEAEGGEGQKKKAL